MSDMGITEEGLAESLGFLSQIGPTEETIRTAVEAGFVNESFLAPPPPPAGGPGGGGGDGGGDGGDDGTVVLDKWGRAPDDPDYGKDPNAGPVPPTQPEGPSRESALASIRAGLARYGLEGLAEVLWQKHTQKLVNIEDENALLYSIRDEQAYKTRFAANEARIKAGLPELEPESYLGLEDSYRKVLASNGMPQGFYDSPDDFRAFIEGDVSVAELQGRIQNGYRMVQDADPAVKQKMYELYGVSEPELAAYFIDPQRAKPLLVASDYQRQARAAQIAARAQEQAGISLSGVLAEDLARRGITEAEAMKGFGEIGKLGELAQTFRGEEALTTEQITRAQFGIDTEAEQALERRKRQRVGEFLGGGSFARTTGETSGATTLAVGKSQ